MRGGLEGEWEMMPMPILLAEPSRPRAIIVGGASGGYDQSSNVRGSSEGWCLVEGLSISFCKAERLMTNGSERFLCQLHSAPEIERPCQLSIRARWAGFVLTHIIENWQFEIDGTAFCNPFRCSVVPRVAFAYKLLLNPTIGASISQAALQELTAVLPASLHTN